MPALLNPTAWRQHPHRVQGHLVVAQPPVVFACLVNQAAFPNPLSDITYDNVSVGAYTDIQVGMTVRFISGGEILSYGRIRKAPTSTILYVGAIAYGDLQLSDNDTIEVLDDYRIFAKVPRIDATNPLAVVFYKDLDIAYTSQGHLLPPVANVGPHTAGFVEDDGYLYVSFRGAANSYAMANGATISSYSNSIGDGTYVTGNASSGDFDAKFPPGQRWVRLTVTDSNGITHTAHRFIAACERTGLNAPLRFNANSIRLSLDGTSAEFTILVNDASPSVIPEGTLIVYFEEETYGTGGAKYVGSLNAFDFAEVAYTTYAGVKFVGWTTAASERITPMQDDLTISAVGPTGIMTLMPMFSATVSNAASATGWYDVEYLTLWRMIWYLLHWHTTVLEVCDFVRPAWHGDYPYVRFDSAAGNMQQTVNTLANYVNANVCNDRMGILFAARNPQLMSDSDRNTIDTVVALADSDWSAMDIDTTVHDADYWLRGSGLQASITTITPYLSIAPGKSPGQGGSEDALDNQLVLDQDDLNLRTGRQYALKNNRLPKWTLTNLNAGLVVDPATREWIVLSVAASHTKRQIAVSGRWLVTEIEYSYDPSTGSASESWTYEPETFGVPGETEPVPLDRIDDFGYVGIPEFNPILDDLYDPRPVTTLEFDNSPAVYLCHTAYVTRTRNHTDVTPNYEIVITAAQLDAVAGLTNLEILGMILDPWNPKLSAYLHAWTQDGDNAYVIFYVENLDAIPGAQVMSIVFAGGYRIRAASAIRAGINVQGSLWGLYGIFDIGDYVYPVTRVSSSSAVTAPITNLFLHADGEHFLALGNHMPGAGVGRVYFGARISAAFSNRSIVAMSGAMGTDWLDWYSAPPSQLFFDSYDYGDLSLRAIPMSALHVPYDDNATDNLVYIGYQIESAYSLVRHNDNNTLDNIGPSVGADYYYPKLLSDGLHSFVSNRLAMAVIAQRVAAGTDTLFTTDDGGDTWLDRNAPAGVTDSIAGLWGWPYTQDVMMCTVGAGADRGIWLTRNLFSAGQYGVTWTNLIGDWETVTGDTFTNPSHVIPVWVP